MSFGLTNTLVTFKRLMTNLFKTELDDDVLIFFDDILIYSKTEQEREQHIRRVDLFRREKLYAKNIKCSFFSRTRWLI